MTVKESHRVADRVVGAPARIFPGWTMVGISAAAQFMSAPGQSYSVAAFKEPMQEGLALSETQFSLAYGVATVVSGCVLPWTGRQVDRFGATRVLPLTAGLLTLACFVMSRVSHLPMLYAGFTLIRCLGQGALWLIGAWIVSEWFRRKRGFATAVSGLGGSLSVMLFPLLNYYLISQYGWQTAWCVIGVLVSLALIGPSLLLLKDRPEDIGLQPDGVDDDDSVEPDNGKISPTTDSWTLAEVLRDATFWKLLSASVCAGMIGTGLVFHQVSLMGSRGVAEGMALGLISFQATIGTIAMFTAGWLTDRCRAEWLLAAAMFLLATSVLILMVMPSPAFAIVFAILMGLQGSIFRSAGTVVWVNYYGRANQGVIRGAAMSVMILAAAVGPIPLAMAQDWGGDYSPALMVYTIIPALAMVLLFSARQPTRRGPRLETVGG